MKRRSFIKAAVVGTTGTYLSACGNLQNVSPQLAKTNYFMSVLGPQPLSAMAFTLTHEHLFADLRPYSEQVQSPFSLDLNEVAANILPHLLEIKKLGCKTFIDCTAVGIGRNPLLLRALSKATDMNIVTTTGAYLSADLQFKPDYFDSMTADALAAKWLGEWHNGIDNTGIKPGMIKIGVSGGALTADEKKLLNAAILTHKSSGMVIGCHVGPWREVQPDFNGRSASDQLKLLAEAGVPAARWIWIHAHNEIDFTAHQYALAQGAWLSYDGYRPEQTQQYLDLIARIKTAGHLKNLLVSQDAGWYTAGAPNGGKFNSFAPLMTHLIPALTDKGFSSDEIAQIFVHNPAEAFQIKV